MNWIKTNWFKFGVLISLVFLATSCNKQAVKNGPKPVVENQIVASSTPATTTPEILGTNTSTPTDIPKSTEVKTIIKTVDNFAALQQAQQEADNAKIAQQQAEEKAAQLQTQQKANQDALDAAAAKKAQTDAEAKSAADAAARQAAQQQAQAQAAAQQQQAALAAQQAQQAALQVQQKAIQDALDAAAAQKAQQAEQVKQEALARIQKANEILKQIVTYTENLNNQKAAVREQIEQKASKIEAIKSTPVATSVINGLLAQVVPEYNALVNQYNSLLETGNKLQTIVYEISDYADNGTPVPAASKGFLASIGIYW